MGVCDSKCRMCFVYVAVGSTHKVNTSSSSSSKRKNVAHPFSAFERGKARSSAIKFFVTMSWLEFASIL